MKAFADPTADAPPHRRRLRWLLMTLFVLAALIAGGLAYRWWATDPALAAARAEADRLDPGWRLADLEAARAEVPPEENGAFQVLSAAALLPASWPTPPATGSPSVEDELARLPPPTPLSKAQTGALRDNLGRVAPALRAARRLADMPRGRYPSAWAPDSIGTPMRHVEQVLQVARLLRFDGALRAQDGDLHGALTSWQALLNTERSLGDEPARISQFVRLSCQRTAVSTLERALAQGQASGADLEVIRRLLEGEEKERLQLTANRGFRAAVEQFMDTIQVGHFNPAAYHMISETGYVPADNLLDQGRARATHAAYLSFLNALVELAKLPPEQQAEALRDPGFRPPAGLPRLLAGMTKNEDFRRHALLFHAGLARLRSAVAAVAAERYRRDRGHWPDSLAALVPAYLARVPTNPFDGQPLRYRRLPDGIVIEAPRPEEEGADRMKVEGIRFRLWDPKARRQPPRDAGAS